MRDGMVQFHDALDPLLIPMEEVKAHPNNARNGDVDAIAESIEVNGFIAPVIAQKSTGYIVAGNHRYYALMQMGASRIPVIWVDVDDQAAKRYLLADNRTSDLGTYDNSMLLGLLEEMQAEDLSLSGTGYHEYDVEVLRALNEMPLYSTEDFAQWPTLCFQVPPHVKNAFMTMTAQAGDERDRFELLLRLAGWDGK